MNEAQEVLTRIWSDMLAREHGEYSFRFILQPTMAAVMAIRDGLKDARNHRAPYLWSIIHVPESRAGRLKEGLKAVARIILLSVVMETLFQYRVLHAFYPGEAVIVTFFLCFLPYLVMRGIANRLGRRWLDAKARGK